MNRSELTTWIAIIAGSIVIYEFVVKKLNERKYGD